MLILVAQSENKESMEIFWKIPQSRTLINQNQYRYQLKNMNNCTTICPLPWNHISIQQNGDFRICCQQVFEPYGKMISNGEVLNIKNSTIDTARNHPTMKEVRASMLAGQEHPLCKLCYKDDALGLSSKRKHMLQWYNTSAFHDTTTPDGTIDTSMYPVVYFDIRFGNLCNLKCRYCGPADSSLWY